MHSGAILAQAPGKLSSSSTPAAFGIAIGGARFGCRTEAHRRAFEVGTKVQNAFFNCQQYVAGRGATQLNSKGGQELNCRAVEGAASPADLKLALSSFLRVQFHGCHFALRVGAFLTPMR